MFSNSKVSRVTQVILALITLVFANFAFADSVPSATLQAYGTMSVNAPIRIHVNIANFSSVTSNLVANIVITDCNSSDISSVYALNGSQKNPITLNQNGTDLSGFAGSILADMDFEITFKTPGSHVLGYALNNGSSIITSGSAPVTIAATQVLGINKYNFTRYLRYGNFGEDVRQLQQFLKDQGLFLVNTTGYFGPITKAALIQFQKNNGLPATGYFGPLTQAKILSSY